MHIAIAFLLALFTTSVASAEDPPEFACNEPVLWMAKYGAEDFAQPYCEACNSGRQLDGKDGCIADVRADARAVMTHVPQSWGDSSGARERVVDCAETDYAIQLLRAFHGRGLDDPSWSGYFERRFEWFDDRPRASYPKKAPAIIKSLKKARAECLQARKPHLSEIRSVQRALKRGRHVREVLSFTGFHGTGMTAEVIGQGMNRRSRWSIRAQDGHLSDYFQPVSPDREDVRLPPVPDDVWRRKFSTIVGVNSPSHFENGFGCVGECGGGHSNEFYLNAKNEVLAQSHDHSACPFVYTGTDGRWTFEGEILRNLNRRELEGAQTLLLNHAVNACRRGLVEVRLTEEKQEITHLDAIELHVGEHVIAPTSCVAHPDRNFCTDNGAYLELEEGEEMVFRFDVPADLTGECGTDLELWADGFYVPIANP